MRLLNTCLLTLPLLLSTLAGYSQSIIVDNTTQTPEQLVNNVLTGSGVTVSNITFNGTVANAQIIQESVGSFNNNGTAFPLNAGLILATGDAQVATGPNNQGGATQGGGNFGQDDPDLEIIEPAGINDAAVLEFDFVPSGDTVRFRYIFASEEYEEYVNGGFNDAFGFFIAGPGITGPYSSPGGFPNGSTNIALIPGTTTPVTIDNVNHLLNQAYYQNMNGAADIQFDGRTVILEAVAQVQCGQTYHIKLAIGDAGDTAFDSAVFLEADSFSSNSFDMEVATLAGDTIISEGCDTAYMVFTRPSGQTSTTLTVDVVVDPNSTATTGTDYTPLPDSVVFPIGVDTIFVPINAFVDGINDNGETIIITGYTINVCGDTISSTGTLIINDPATYSVITSDTSFSCPDPNIPITVSASGGLAPHTWTWQHGPTGASITVDGTTPGTQTYTVDVIDACGVASTGSVDVTYTPYTPSIIFNQNTFTVCPGQSITITATEQNSQGSISWAWDHGDVTASTTVSPTGNAGDEVWYYVELTDGCHTVRDSVKAVIGQADITSINITDATGCPPLFSNNNGQVDVITNPGTGMTVTLTQQGGSNTVHTPTGTYDFSGVVGGYSYLLHVEDPLGCTADSIIVVGVGQDPVTFDLVTDSINDITCFGDGNGTAYINNISSTGGHPYTVEWINGGVVVTTTNLTAPDVDDYQNTLDGGTWSVTVTNPAGCAWTETFVINEPPELINTLVPVEPSCYEMVNPDGSIEVNVTGGTTPYSYTWTNSSGTPISNSDVANNLGEDTYTVTTTDARGCTDVTTLFLAQPDSIAFTITTTDVKCTDVDNGTIFITDVTVNGLNDYGIFIIPGSITPTPMIQGSDTVYFYNHLADGTYVIQIVDSLNQCYVPDIEVTINEAPAINWIDVQTYAIDTDCQIIGGNGSVSAGASGGHVDQFTYNWYYLPNDTTVQSTSPTWGNRTAGDYLVYAIEDSTDCRVDTILTVDQINPIADFSVDTTWAFAPHTIDLENLSQNSTSWTWYVNGVEYATSSYSFAPDTTINNPDTVNICLYAFKLGCVDSVCQTVVIVPPPQFIFPNVFTPNNDPGQTNEVFFLPLDGITDFECEIFNRWGRPVTVLTPANPSWDGTINGNDASEGQYFYHYTLTSFDGTEFKGQGAVTLIRK